MNSITKITPPLQQIYNHRYQYHQHQKKLAKIYEYRKSQLGNSLRAGKLDNLKDEKSRSFMSRFNQHYNDIQKQNLKLLQKLENVRPSIQRSISQERDRANVTPFMKRRVIETEKQNERISSRMKNMQSTLNKKNFVKDYVKSQQIKARIMRYTANDSQVYLKSERYFRENDENDSVLSYKSKKQPSKPKPFPISSVKVNGIKPSLRESVITHYKKQDILKNRVDVRTSSLAGIKAKCRPNTSVDNAQNQNELGFFSTQPYKNKKVGMLRRKLVD